MALTPGTRLGVYEVTAQIGEGGMGEVYKAHDSKLGRDVAIKILPRISTTDSERLARFEREAQLLASLNQLTGTDNGRYPFWSPDGRSLGFFADAQLKRLDLDSGFVQALAAAPLPFGGAWNREGTILYCPSSGGPVFRMSAGGGQPTAVTQVTPQMEFHMSPQFLPDGQHFLFWTLGSAVGIYAGQLDGSKPRLILDAEAAVYASSGYLLFLRQGTLFAQPFDPVRLTLAGSPAAIADHVVAPRPGTAALSASEAGSIVYRTGASGPEQQFVWFDRSGRALEKVAGSEISKGTSSSLSPDGRRLAMEVNGRSSAADLWLVDLDRGVPSRLTFDPAFDLFPVWSPDGNRIAFSSNRGKEGFDLYVKSASGAGSEQLILGGEGAQVATTDWSPDGRFLLYTTKVGTSNDIWALPVGGDQKPFSVAQTPFAETSGQFSPDGQWVAYQSNESGRFEIWVQPFSGPGVKSQISSGGGVQVRWRQDGTELFYLAPDDRLMAAPIRLDGQHKTVDVGTPVSLFAAHLSPGSQSPSTRYYHVSHDGQRFLMLGTPEVTLSISVILNWKPKP